MRAHLEVLGQAAVFDLGAHVDAERLLLAGTERDHDVDERQAGNLFRQGCKGAEEGRGKRGAEEGRGRSRGAVEGRGRGRGAVEGRGEGRGGGQGKGRGGGQGRGARRAGQGRQSLAAVVRHLAQGVRRG